MLVEECAKQALNDWVALRKELWPHAKEEEHLIEVARMLEQGDRAVGFLVRDGAVAAGFAEATLRFDHVNGCSDSPVAFLEGVYVRPGWRRRGAARLLSGAVEAWARGLGCSELASDAELINETSRRMHAALGFEETERVVFFRKRLLQK